MTQRVAILGGGIAGLTAAYELTAQPGWNDHFDVTIYQLGWRLGGKGASGRNVSGPEGIRGRIEEHGLHVWFGFYENAFWLMRRCYAELERPDGAPLATWEEAFKPHRFVGSQESIDSLWRPWLTETPVSDSVPGMGNTFPTALEYLQKLLHYAVQMLGELGRDVRGRESGIAGGLRRLLRIAGVVSGASALLLLEGAGRILETLRPNGEGRTDRGVSALDAVLARVLRGLHDLERQVARDIGARRAYIGADIALATLRGLVVEDLFERGFSSVEDVDFSEWLRRHGASKLSLKSAFMRSTYDTVFGFVAGDPAKEAISAGTALRSGLRMFFGYKGAFLWLMQAGMGDVVFAPLYEVLKRRGVKFEFFHRVEALHLSPDSRRIASIELRRQARLNGPTYDPLIDTDGLACWPSEPLYDQLVEGAELKRRWHSGENVNLESFWSSWEHGETYSLRHGDDYDHVLLAIPISCFRFLCRELIEARPAWSQMVAKVQTMRTMAAQFWLTASASDLGWTAPPALLSGFVRPLSTWADMSHLIAREAAPEADGPKHLAYFCGPMLDSDEPAPFTEAAFAAAETAKVAAEARALMRDHIRALWPNFTWELLYDPSGAAGEERLAAQYVRANIDPSERYVLSVAGSAQCRLREDASGFDNLTLAGDWTDNGLNAGCIEAAVMSGMRAARAISGSPQTIVGEEDGIPISF